MVPVFFEYNWHKVYYLLVESGEIEDQIGRNTSNLLFVAKDKAPEDRQQKRIVGYEYVEARSDHNIARQKEVEWDRTLGKESKYYT